jgi:hypothetical protein
MNFIIQKLKNKHIFLKKLSNWAKLNSLILREREETITKYFAPKTHQIVDKKMILNYKDPSIWVVVPRSLIYNAQFDY